MEKLRRIIHINSYLQYIHTYYSTVTCCEPVEHIKLMSPDCRSYKTLVSCVMQRSGPQVIQLFSCSTQFSMKFFLLVNVEMPTIVGISTFKSRKNSILGLYKPEKCLIFLYFHTYEHLKFHAQQS